jgi:hypothetical protein
MDYFVAILWYLCEFLYVLLWWCELLCTAWNTECVISHHCTYLVFPTDSQYWLISFFSDVHCVQMLSGCKICLRFWAVSFVDCSFGYAHYSCVTVLYYVAVRRLFQLSCMQKCVAPLPMASNSWSFCVFCIVMYFVCYKQNLSPLMEFLSNSNPSTALLLPGNICLYVVNSKTCLFMLPNLVCHSSGFCHFAAMTTWEFSHCPYIATVCWCSWCYLQAVCVWYLGIICLNSCMRTGWLYTVVNIECHFERMNFVLL